MPHVENNCAKNVCFLIKNFQHTTRSMHVVNLYWCETLILLAVQGASTFHWHLFLDLYPTANHHSLHREIEYQRHFGSHEIRKLIHLCKSVL